MIVFWLYFDADVSIVRKFTGKIRRAVNHSFFDISAVSKVREASAISNPDVDVGALTNIDAATLDDSYVYLHCYFQNKWENMLIRIWKTTFPVDSLSGTRSKLVHAENISM